MMRGKQKIPGIPGTMKNERKFSGWEKQISFGHQEA
jgi:hypothetical protein